MTSALDDGGCVVAELEISGVWPAEELDSATGGVAELSGCVWVSEDAGSVALEGRVACSLEELRAIPLWLSNGADELSSPHATKRLADKSAPVNAKEICKNLCMA